MIVGAWWAWPLALAVYLVFRAWYDNWRGPLSQAEIEAFLAETAKTKVGEHTDRAVIRAFLEADDGKEFIMSTPEVAMRACAAMRLMRTVSCVAPS